MNIKSKKRSIIYIASLILFIIYLIYANDVIILLSGSAKLEKTEISSLIINTDAYQAIGFSKAYENMAEDFACNGWAFCETADLNSDKKISIIFRGSNDSYIAPAKLTSFQLKSVFPELTVKGDNNGFGTQFSTLNMKNGIYELLIYDWENDYSSGLARTGRKYIKDNKGLREYTPGQVKNIDDTNKSDNVWFAIAPTQADGNVILDGWAYVNNHSTLFQNVYLEFKNNDGEIQTYDTISYERPDVSQNFKNQKYFSSGFKVTIPQEKLKNSTCTVIIEDAGTFQKATYSVHYDPATNKIS